MKRKLDFFCKSDFEPELKDYLLIYILSILDPKSQAKAGVVNKHWKELVSLSRHYLSLLPTIHRIPSFTEVGLDVLRLKLLTGGMTNSTYRIKLRSSSDQWALRIPGKGSSAFITRKNEAYNAQQASQLGLNVPIDFFDPIDGLQLTRFIKGVKPLDEMALARKEILQTIAGLMLRLHSSKPFDNNCDFFEKNKNLLDELKIKTFSFPFNIRFIENQMGQLSALFSAFDIPKTPCHNDTTPLNFLLCNQGNGVETQEQIHMIDWEYSSNNDFIWDLVYFSIEAKLSKAQELTLLNAYFGEDNVTSSTLAWFEVYKPVIEWWITLWSWTQFTNKANAVDLTEYKQLGDICYKKTLASLESQAYKEAVNKIEEEKTLDPSFSGIRTFK